MDSPFWMPRAGLISSSRELAPGIASAVGVTQPVSCISSSDPHGSGGRIRILCVQISVFPREVGFLEMMETHDLGTI